MRVMVVFVFLASFFLGFVFSFVLARVTCFGTYVFFGGSLYLKIGFWGVDEDRVFCFKLG